MAHTEPPCPDPRTLDGIPAAGGIGMTLGVGPWRIALSGLESEVVRALRRRWGGFASDGLPDDPVLDLMCATGGRQPFGLVPDPAGEVYRIEGAMVSGRPVVRSYNFCMTPLPGAPSAWKIVLGGAAGEPVERTIENAVRCLVSRLALQAGGFALHGAGVRKEGLVWIYAGGSGSGKSTAVGLSAPCESLGDDYAVVLPGQGGWVTCALPFDNSERAPESPPAGLMRLQAVLRLFHAGAGQSPCIQVPPAPVRTASLMNSVMLPGLFGDLRGAALAHVGRFALEGRTGHLHFHRDRRFVREVLAFVGGEGSGAASYHDRSG